MNEQPEANQHDSGSQNKREEQFANPVDDYKLTPEGLTEKLAGLTASQPDKFKDWRRAMIDAFDPMAGPIYYPSGKDRQDDPALQRALMDMNKIIDTVFEDPNKDQLANE